MIKSFQYARMISRANRKEKIRHCNNREFVSDGFNEEKQKWLEM
jgi:hypothetical protein